MRIRLPVTACYGLSPSARTHTRARGAFLFSPPSSSIDCSEKMEGFISRSAVHHFLNASGLSKKPTAWELDAAVDRLIRQAWLAEANDSAGEPTRLVLGERHLGFRSFLAWFHTVIPCASHRRLRAPLHARARTHSTTRSTRLESAGPRATAELRDQLRLSVNSRCPRCKEVVIYGYIDEFEEEGTCLDAARIDGGGGGRARAACRAHQLHGIVHVSSPCCGGCASIYVRAPPSPRLTRRDACASACQVSPWLQAGDSQGREQEAGAGGRDGHNGKAV